MYEFESLKIWHPDEVEKAKYRDYQLGHLRDVLLPPNPLLPSVVEWRSEVYRVMLSSLVIGSGLHDLGASS